MQKYRLHLMIVMCIGLAAMVWFDSQQRAGSPGQPSLASGGPPQGSTSVAPTDAPAAPDPAGTAPSPISIGNPLASTSKDQLRDMVERPLLAPSRRRPPDAQATGPSEAASNTQQSYDLLGILRNGDRAIALLRRASDGTSFRVEIGDTVGGWRVAKVETTSVLLERNDGTSLAVPLNR